MPEDFKPAEYEDFALNLAGEAAITRTGASKALTVAELIALLQQLDPERLLLVTVGGSQEEEDWGEPDPAPDPADPAIRITYS